ncbi:MAG: preprotein translocase subunit SecA [bacterium]|nr:preprotein translocase subunit SecA [bacterium]
MWFDLILARIFGTKQERDIKRLQPMVDEIKEWEEEISRLTDEQLAAKTPYFKQKLADGETLDDILPEAFAVAREVAKRTVNMRPFDVQLMGGIVLHEGKIAEMKTGEGKTLVATMPVYLNALMGKGVHVVTVNDYLAKRDAHWMGPIYHLLGLSVGVIQHEAAFLYDPEYEKGEARHQHLRSIGHRREAYAADITYGTNNEFGFDYLRDNMVPDLSLRVQRGHFFGIVDEVDSILIDEARTPLIISGPAEESTDKYYKINRIIPRLKAEVDFQVDEKMRTAAMTEEGVTKVEGLLKLDNLYDPQNMEIAHHVNQALKAHTLFKRDRDYLVKEGQVIIVDEFTGRLMPGRRYSEGLHQALEAKEGVKIAQENQTLATITFQNYFKMYEKLAGMTGTADTEAEEFDKIYKLEVVVIPTNVPMIREDYADVVYKTEREKFKAITDEIVEMNHKRQPVLVGTISVEKSEKLSAILKKQGIRHQVLNAKYHEKEAEIVAEAGQPMAVTIATNMAGRGTDIVLGEGIPDLGGLHIIGTERHEARRIDNQLRGRCARQGDPGSSRFYLSLEDDLMRIFGSDKVSGLMDKLGLEEGEVIEHPWVTKAIERAQCQVESQNFDIRKRLLEYDDVMNQQRQLIYHERDLVLKEPDISNHIQETIEEVLEEIILSYCNPDDHPEDWDTEGLCPRLSQTFGLNMNPEEIKSLKHEELFDHILERVKNIYEGRKRKIGPEQFNGLQRYFMLSITDHLWKDHLYAMDSLKEGIGLRAYGQRDPLVEYKHESYKIFEHLMLRIKEEVVEYIFRLRLEEETTPPGTMARPGEIAAVQVGAAQPRKKKDRNLAKIGRNDPCPCGSGKKYKRCCG